MAKRDLIFDLETEAMRGHHKALGVEIDAALGPGTAEALEHILESQTVFGFKQAVKALRCLHLPEVADALAEFGAKFFGELWDG